MTSWIWPDPVKADIPAAQIHQLLEKIRDLTCGEFFGVLILLSQGAGDAFLNCRNP